MRNTSILTGILLLFAVGSSERIRKCSNDLGLVIRSPDGSGNTALTEHSIETTLLTEQKLREVEISLNLDHSYVADLVITVRHKESQKSVILVNKQCPAKDLNAIFSDAAKKELICENRDQGIPFQPCEVLSEFDGLSYESNTWTISFDDTHPADHGILHSWCVSYDEFVPRYVALVGAPNSMGQARERCAEIFGTDLAIIRDSNANLEARNVCADICGIDSDCKGCWIGLSDLKKEGVYTWIDGTPLTFEGWNSGQPNNSGGNKNCVSMKKSEEYQWHDRSCDAYDRIPLCRNPDLDRTRWDPTVVRVATGKIRGSLTRTSRVFQGIPFGVPPVGYLRWKEAMPARPWKGILDCTSPGPQCYQLPCDGDDGCVPKTSEDCLYLNVFTPLDAKEGDLFPVMFFIHGGSFDSGTGGAPLYGGTPLAGRHDVIVVTVNYRLGVFGFYWNEALGFQGNYGITDQMLALEWTYQNIGRFGGNPDQITVFGQSAGAASVALLLAAERTRGLIAASIWQSEHLGIPLRNKQSWGSLPGDLLTRVNCDRVSPSDSIACLYSLNSQELYTGAEEAVANLVVTPDNFLNSFLPWAPTVGTELLQIQPLWAFQEPQTYNVQNVPLLQGSVADEATLFAYRAFPDGLPQDVMLFIVSGIVGQANMPLLLQQYPLPVDTLDYRDYVSEIITDGLFHCPNRNVSATHSTYNANSYLYHFEHLASFNADLWSDRDSACRDVVCHDTELYFIFEQSRAREYLLGELDLAERMQAYWASFASSFDPMRGTGEDVQWYPYEENLGRTLVFGSEEVVRIEEGYDDSKCELWDQIGYTWLGLP